MALQNVLRRLFSNIQNAFYYNFPHFFPENFALATVNLPKLNPSQSIQDLKELVHDSILWAVPKKRRSVEKRRNRKFGWPQYGFKTIQPKTNILICTKCGSNYIAGQLCAFCYDKVMKETKEMQEIIEKELNIGPVEKEVVVLYEDDKPDPELFEGKRIIEMKKKRPKLFSDNLLQKSMQGLSNKTDVATINNLIKSD